jgi:hypothetical protein
VGFIQPEVIATCMTLSGTRRLTAVWAIIQGLQLAALPGVTVAVVRRLVGENFAGADGLEARPGYVRQLRATGIGLAAAGIAGAAMERVADDPSDKA